MPTPGTGRPWYTCGGNPCTCPKPVSVDDEPIGLAGFTDAELVAELERRKAAR